MINYNTYLYFDEDEAIYVGKGKKKRILVHLNRKDMHPFVQRLQKMKREGREPTVRVLPNLTEQRALMTEQLLIAVFGRKDLGTGTLLNLTPGGELPPPVLSGDRNPMRNPETVKRNLEARIKNGTLKRPSAEYSEQASERMKAYYAKGFNSRGGFGKRELTLEYREKMKAAANKRWSQYRLNMAGHNAKNAVTGAR